MICSLYLGIYFFVQCHFGLLHHRKKGMCDRPVMLLCGCEQRGFSIPPSTTVCVCIDSFHMASLLKGKCQLCLM